VDAAVAVADVAMAEATVGTMGGIGDQIVVRSALLIGPLSLDSRGLRSLRPV
jgi:hypothetical protein